MFFGRDGFLSGAESLGQMRGPVDVLHLAELLGIPSHQVRAFGGNSCRNRSGVVTYPSRNLTTMSCVDRPE